MNKNIRVILIALTLCINTFSYTALEPLTTAKITELKKLRADRLLPQINAYLSPDSPWSQELVDALNQLINDYENKSKAKIKANELRTQLSLMWQTAQQTTGKEQAEKELELTRAEVTRLQENMQNILQTRGKQIETLVKKRAEETEKAKSLSGQAKAAATNEVETLKKAIDALEAKQQAAATDKQSLEIALQNAQAGKAGAEKALQDKLAAMQQELDATKKRAEEAEKLTQSANATIKELNELTQTQKMQLTKSTTRSKQLETDLQAGKMSQDAATVSLDAEKTIRETLEKEIAEKKKQIDALTNTMTQITGDLIAKDEALKTIKTATEKAEKDMQEATRRAEAAEKAQTEIANTVKQLEEQKKKLEQAIVSDKKRAQELEQQAKTEKNALKKEFAQILADEHKRAQTEMSILQQQREQQITELQNTINGLHVGIAQSQAAFEKEKLKAQNAVKVLQEAQAALQEARMLNANRLLRLVILRRTKQKSEAREAAIKAELKTATAEQQKALQEKLAQEQQFKKELTQLQNQETQSRQKAEKEMEALRKQSTDSSQQITAYEKQIQALQETTRQAMQDRTAAEKIAEQKDAELAQKIIELERTITEKNSALEKIGKEKTEEREKLQKEIQALQNKINGAKKEEQKQGWFASWFGGPREDRKSSTPLTPEERKARREEEKGTEMEEIETSHEPTAQEVYNWYQGLPS